MRNALRDWAIAGALSLLAALPYLAAGLSGNFVQLDDPQYVTANPQVLRGLGVEGLLWALTTFHFANWHPLTWLSHMLDVTLFGLDARGHHATSVVLHALNAGFLFLALRRMTGAVGPSAFAAAVFGVHPLRVESVAWVAERKDVLAGLFFMLVLLTWERYARRGGSRRYLTALGLFALGLAAKPMLVTVPFVLLLLDVWPLRRAPPAGTGGPAGWGGILLEKVPFLALALASSVVTVLAQRAWGALETGQVHPLGPRVANAVVSCAAYLADAVWPAGLAVFYPFPAAPMPWPAVAGSASLVALLSLAVVRRRRVQPFLAVGWCWFLGMLVPVLGVVQVGAQARADRYTYLPLVGVLVAVAWLAAQGLPAALRRVRVLGPAAAAVVAAFAAASAVQAGYWKDGETLFRRAVAVTEDNWLARFSLAKVLADGGRHEEAVPHFLEGLERKPDFKARKHLGNSLAALGRHEEAAVQYREALGMNPDDAEVRFNLGNSLTALGRHEGAAAEYREAVRINPRAARVHNNLGTTLAVLGQFAEACDAFGEAVRLSPGFAEYLVNLGKCLAAVGRLEDAEASLREALRLAPGHAAARAELSGLARRRASR